MRSGSGEENRHADLSGLGIARKNGEMRARRPHTVLTGHSGGVSQSEDRKQTRPPPLVIPE